MKLLKTTTFYPSYLNYFYRKHPELIDKSFAEQKAALDYDAFGWADYWSNALTPLGFEVMEIIANAEPMQRVWARENSVPGYAGISLDEIVLAQTKRFRPDILWFEDYNIDLLKNIKSEVSSVRLTLGWVGSAIPRTDIWRQMDLILSCAQESVETLNKAGYSATQLHHGFDPRINERLQERPKQFNFSFIGQLIRFNTFHLQREFLLEQLAMRIGLDIFSPSADIGWKDDLRALVMAASYGGVKFLKAVGFPESALRALPVIGIAVDLPSRPLSPINPILKRFIKPGVFGLEMFQVIRDSKIALNIHADSSPRYASNMRLFETTGIGTCMVTDWKDNLPDLFDPDTEIVTYKTVDECVEKVIWLLNHPNEREEIARAGQARTLREHTFSNRAVILNEIIKKRMRARKCYAT
jgi:spore maturation protein CgeB